MARNQIQTGMFGPLPHEVQEMQMLENERRALNVAQLTPGQRGVYHSSLAGAGMGAGINRIFGNEGEDMRRAKQMKEIDKEVRESGIDPSNFEAYYGQLGEKFAKAGLIKEAASVADALQAYKDKQATIETKKYDSETARIRAEAFRTSKLSKSAIAQEIFKKNKEYTPESLQAYLDSITDENPNGNMAKLKPYNEPAGYKEVATTDQGHIVFDNEQATPVVRINGQLVPYDPSVHGKATGKGTKVDVSVGGSNVTVENQSPKPPNAYSEIGAKLVSQQAEANYKAFLPKYESAVAQTPKVKRMRELVDAGNLITGSFSDFRKEATRLASTLGLGSPKDVAKLNDSDLYDKFVMGTVLDMMKQLGGSDSNEELRSLRTAAETRQWNPSAIKRALAWIESEQNRIKTVNKRYNEGLGKGRRDPYNFDWTAGEWRTDEEIPIAGDEGTSKVKTETKKVPAGQSQAAANAAAVPAARTAPSNFRPSTPEGNAKFEAAIDKFSVAWGLSREETAKRLLEEKAKREAAKRGQ